MRAAVHLALVATLTVAVLLSAGASSTTQLDQVGAGASSLDTAPPCRGTGAGLDPNPAYHEIFILMLC